jgi:hypothetical protein
MKYVMLRRGGYRFPVLFPDAIEHSQFEGADIVSAGFFSVMDSGDVSTFGESKSLKGLKPKKGDAAIIQTFMGGFESMLILSQTT